MSVLVLITNFQKRKQKFLPLWPASCRGLPLDERQSAAELEAVLQHHHNLQEKLADDMLNLARNLKNNSLAAQNIIKQDNQVGEWTRTALILYCPCCGTECVCVLPLVLS